MYSVTLWQHSSWECKKSFHCVFAAEGVRWRIKMEFMIRRFLFCYGLATTQWTSLAAQFWKMKIFPTKKGKMTDIFSAPAAGPVRVQLVPAWRLRAGQILRQQGEKVQILLSVIWLKMIDHKNNQKHRKIISFTVNIVHSSTAGLESKVVGWRLQKSK